MKHVKGVIAAGDPQTLAAGIEILERGGNAIDAVVAAAFASFVSEMVLVNISGGGIATIHLAKSRQNLVYDFFCDMPTGHYDEDLADFKRIVIDFGAATQPFYIGRASSAVPGVAAGLCKLAADHGSLPLPALLEPAIKLAQEGIIISDSLGYVSEILADIFMDTPESAAIYAPNGQIAKAGDTLQNLQLAKTLQTLGQEGCDYYYSGELAHRIVADQQANGGLITQTDLRNYRPRRLTPITISYGDYTVLLPPLSSIGGTLIAFTLKLLEAVWPKGISHSDAIHIKLLSEAMRLTNVARKNLQPDEPGVRRFLGEGNISKYRQILLDILAGAASPTEAKFPPDHSDTTHISVMDSEGNLASVTTSAGEGAGFMVNNTGVAMNNMLGEVDLHPNGFHQSLPGKRLQTMMSPTIVLKHGEPVLVLGSGGSTRLRSAIVQVLSGVLDFGLSLPEAINAPRIHFEEGTLQAEGGIAGDVIADLRRQGYRVNVWAGKNMYFGGVHAVGRVSGHWVAAGDARRGGAAKTLG